MSTASCRAKGGPANCTSNRCPARRAAMADMFTGPALGSFGDPTGFPFYELTATTRFREVLKEAVNQAVDQYDDLEQESEAVGYATSLVRNTYPEGSQALHMMDHNTGVLAASVRDAVQLAYEVRGIQ